MAGIDDLVTAVQQAMEDSLSRVNTSVPGTVVSYDPATNRARVRPSMPRKLANGDALPSPDIVQVPVVWPASGMAGKQAGITLPIAPGDGVMLSFQQRSLENWLSGNNDAPDDPRQFDLSDCVATPGLNSAGFKGDAENVVIRMDQAQITLKPDNTVIFGNANASITIAPGGEITIKGSTINIDAGGKQFVLQTHVHDQVERGGDMSGEPLG